MRPDYSGYQISKKDDRQVIIDNLKYEYADYLGSMNLEQLRAVAKSNSFELKARKPLTDD